MADLTVNTEKVDTKSIAAQLAGEALFKRVKAADLEVMVDLMERQTFSKGAVLFKKGDAGDTMYIILTGRLRIYTQDDAGHEFILTHYGPGRVFGDFAMVDEQPRSASAQAEENLTVLVLTRAKFLEFLPAHTSVGMAILNHLTDRVRYITNYLSSVTTFIEGLSRNEYEEALREITQSNPDLEMQQVITAFAKMVHSLQDREEEIKQSPSKTSIATAGLFNKLSDKAEGKPEPGAKAKPSLFDLDRK